MAYMGVDYSSSLVLGKIVRRDSDSLPSLNDTWDLGSPLLKWKNIYATSFIGDLVGNSSTSSAWLAPITITIDGDATGTVSFDGVSNQTLTLSINDDSHNHNTSTIINFNENVQDVVGTMIGTTSGIDVVYDDLTNKLNFSVNALSSLSFNGDVTGSVSGNIATLTIVDDSHSHDTQYYTKAQSDLAYYPNSGGTISGDVIISGNLTVDGVTTSVNSTTVDVGDNIIVLNSGETGSPTLDAGIEINRGLEQNTKIIWEESTQTWKVAFADGSKALFGNVANPTLGSHVGDRDYNDNRYINTTGDTLTGTLNAQHIIPSSNNLYDLGSSTNAFKTLYLETSPTTDKQVGNRGYNDLRYVAIADSTIVRTNVASGDTKQKWFEANNTNVSGTVQWDLDNEQVKIMTLTGLVTMSAPLNQHAGGSYILVVKYSGSFTISSWDSVFKFPNGVKPTLTATAGAIDVISFISDGINMLGVEQKNFL